jgi:hypothetical protein
MRRPLVLVLTWVLGTALALGFSMLAVRAVGRRLERPPQAVPVAAAASPATSTTPAGPAAPTSAPAGPVAGGPAAPGAPTTTAAPAPASTSPPPPAPGTYRTDGGVVVVSCTGEIASLVAASPAVGWSVDVREAGPERVEVRFELAGAEHAEEGEGGEEAPEHDEAEAAAQARVRASCANGTIEAEVS